jgi:hypothetical protein
MARLDFTASNILTAAEMDELARQATSNVTNAGKPTGTAEGETVAVTDKDRLEHWDGAAWQRGTNWASAGRTWVTKTENGAGATSCGNGVAVQIAWTGGTDADGFYTGWDGTNYEFTVPSGLGGIYLITTRWAFSGGWTPNTSDVLRILVSGQAIDFPQQGIAGSYHASLIRPLTAGATVAVVAAQYSGGALTIAAGADFTMARMCV